MNDTVRCVCGQEGRFRYDKRGKPFWRCLCGLTVFMPTGECFRAYAHALGVLAREYPDAFELRAALSNIPVEVGVTRPVVAVETEKTEVHEEVRS